MNYLKSRLKHHKIIIDKVIDIVIGYMLEGERTFYVGLEAVVKVDTEIDLL